MRELLESMVSLQFNGDFEVVIVEDGSSTTSREIVEQFNSQLHISYYSKPNTGPGDSRNYGMKKAKGNYFIILDSDVILPQNYLAEVYSFLSQAYYDCYGGPDAAHESFSTTQKAINYSMTSLWTTGGIRGRKTAVGKFQPRSFNMGISQEAFEVSGGFGFIHPGEDPDLSLRLSNLGFETTLIPNAAVFHKRRIDWEKFYNQVKKFGMVRPILNKWHPASSKITYWFPSLFIIGFLLAILLLFVGLPYFIYLYIFYFVVIGLDASIRNKSFNIGIKAVIATIIQFWGYGTGFLASVWKIKIRKLNPQIAFPQLFFKDAEKK